MRHVVENVELLWVIKPIEVVNMYFIPQHSLNLASTIVTQVHYSISYKFMARITNIKKVICCFTTTCDCNFYRDSHIYVALEPDFALYMHPLHYTPTAF